MSCPAAFRLVVAVQPVVVAALMGVVPPLVPADPCALEVREVVSVTFSATTWLVTTVCTVVSFAKVHGPFRFGQPTARSSLRFSSTISADSSSARDRPAAVATLLASVLATNDRRSP